MQSWIWKVGAVALLLVVAGCGPSATSQVTGKITLDGAPLDAANLQLVGKDSMFSTTTDAAGKFTFDDGGGPPMAPGDYVILVSKRVLPADAANQPGGGMGSDREVVPAEYQDKEKSPLKVDVKGPVTEAPAMEIKSAP